MGTGPLGPMGLRAHRPRKFEPIMVHRVCLGNNRFVNQLTCRWAVFSERLLEGSLKQREVNSSPNRFKLIQIQIDSSPIHACECLISVALLCVRSPNVWDLWERTQSLMQRRFCLLDFSRIDEIDKITN